MADTLTPLKELSEQEQAAYFHSRARTRSFRDPAKGLFRTHLIQDALDLPVATIDTDVLFPSRDLAITLVTEIEVQGAGNSGIIWEFGSSAQGAKLAVDAAGSFFLAAGDDAGTDGVDGSVVAPGLAEIGARFHLTVAFVPGAGLARMWIDGELVLRLGDGTPFLNNEWADTEDGAFLSAHNTSSTQRGQTINAAPFDFIGVRPLSIFQGQIPRQFD